MLIIFIKAVLREMLGNSKRTPLTTSLFPKRESRFLFNGPFQGVLSFLERLFDGAPILSKVRFNGNHRELSGFLMAASLLFS